MRFTVRCAQWQPDRTPIPPRAASLRATVCEMTPFRSKGITPPLRANEGDSGFAIP